MQEGGVRWQREEFGGFSDLGCCLHAGRRFEVAAGGIWWVFGCGRVGCCLYAGRRGEVAAGGIWRVFGMVGGRFRQLQGIVRVETQKPQSQGIVRMETPDAERCQKFRASPEMFGHQVHSV